MPLTGPRQVGKTSLLRHQYPSLAYATFDDPALARQAETQPDTFFAAHPGPLIEMSTSTGDEVDIVIERGAKFIAVECKLTETTRRDATKGIAALRAYYGTSAVEKAYVACRTPHRHSIDSDFAVEARSVLDLVDALPGRG